MAFHMHGKIKVWNVLVAFYCSQRVKGSLIVDSRIATTVVKSVTASPFIKCLKLFSFLFLNNGTLCFDEINVNH